MEPGSKSSLTQPNTPEVIEIDLYDDLVSFLSLSSEGQQVQCEIAGGDRQTVSNSDLNGFELQNPTVEPVAGEIANSVLISDVSAEPGPAPIPPPQQGELLEWYVGSELVEPDEWQQPMSDTFDFVQVEPVTAGEETTEEILASDEEVALEPVAVAEAVEETIAPEQEPESVTQPPAVLEAERPRESPSTEIQVETVVQLLESAGPQSAPLTTGDLTKTMNSLMGSYLSASSPEMPVTTCLHCGGESDADDLFCISCGSFMEASEESAQTDPACNDCGAVIEPDEVFCPSCGSLVSEGWDTTPAALSL